MSDFELYNNEFLEEDLIELDRLRDLLSTNIPESTERAISKITSSSLNPLKTAILAGTFLLYISVNNPAISLRQIDQYQNTPTAMMTELCDYDKYITQLSSYIRKEAEFVLNKNKEVNELFDFDKSLNSVSFSTTFFEEAKPLSGKELGCLNEYYSKSKKSIPTLPNRS